MLHRLHEINLDDYIGKEVVFKALVTASKASKTKSDKDYLDVELRSKHINISKCKKWNTGDIEVAKPGKVYMVTARPESYMDRITISIDSLDEMPYEDSKDYLDRVEGIESIIEYIETALDKLPDTDIMKVTKDIYYRYKEKFVYYPAAKSHHHNLIGGLAWHSYDLIKLSAAMRTIYPSLKLDLLVGISLLHDMGKTREYSIDEIGLIGFTKEGSLLGHIPIMLSEIDITIAKLGLDALSDDMLALKNGVASHHGKLEWGSPVIPYTVEAKLVHHLDVIDSEMFKANMALLQMEDGQVETSYSFGAMVGLFKYS